MTEFGVADLFNVAEVEIIYHKRPATRDWPIVNKAEAAYEIFKASWDYNKIDLLEQFQILLLAKNNRCLGISHIATGGVSTCIADPKVIFSTALKCNASGIILAHNHPSGSLKPSISDIELTCRMAEGGRLLGIQVMDHLILTSDSYVSLVNEGLAPGW